jgi:exopolysaccharide production protein ExoQ
MSPLLATAIVACGVLLLFALETRLAGRASWALWIPISWMSVASSRNVSEWLSFSAPSEGGQAYLEGSPLDRNILTLLIVAGIIVLFRRQSRLTAIIRESPAILVYFGYCAISFIWSDFPDVSLKRWFRSVGDIVMVLVVLTDRNCLNAIKWFFASVGFIVVPMSVLVIRFYSHIGRSIGMWDGKLGWTGVTTSKNLLGMICLIYGLASLWRVLAAWTDRADRRFARTLLVHGSMVGMSLWLIVMADSATSLACFGIGGGMMVLTKMSTWARKRAVLYLSVSAIVLGLASILFLQIGSGLVNQLGRDSTLTGRDEIWAMVLEIADSPVLGTGYESFWLGPRLQKIWGLHSQTFNQAHNGYLEIYINLGWGGVTCLAAVLVSGLRRAVDLTARWHSCGGLMIAYFITAVAYNFTEAGFKMMHPVWIALLFVVCLSPRVLLAANVRRASGRPV